MSEARTPHAPVLDVMHVAGGLLVGSMGPLFVAIWRSKPVHATFAIQRSGLARVVAENPGRALFLCVIEATSDPPDDDVRSAAAKMVAGHGNALAGCACVIEGDGFRAAITRTVLTGIALIARAPVPMSFVDSLDAAAVWLEKRARPGELAGLVRQVEAARARLTQS